MNLGPRRWNLISFESAGADQLIGAEPLFELVLTVSILAIRSLSSEMLPRWPPLSARCPARSEPSTRGPTDDHETDL